MKTFVALYMGAPDASGGRPDMSQADIERGMTAWGDWMAANADRLVDPGGPLGKTKRACAAGVSDVRNAVTGYVVLRAESHEAAAALFEDHPHFSIFPGDGVEIMEVLPVPGT
jgi:hypothetical protein